MRLSSATESLRGYPRLRRTIIGAPGARTRAAGSRSHPGARRAWAPGGRSGSWTGPRPGARRSRTPARDSRPSGDTRRPGTPAPGDRTRPPPASRTRSESSCFGRSKTLRRLICRRSCTSSPNRFAIRAMAGLSSPSTSPPASRRNPSTSTSTSISSFTLIAGSIGAPVAPSNAAPAHALDIRCSPADRRHRS